MPVVPVPRILAYLHTRDGRDVGSVVLRKGWAVARYDSRPYRSVPDRCRSCTPPRTSRAITFLAWV